jgi:hypothetical protein
MSAATDLVARIEASGVAVCLEPDGRIRLDPMDALAPDLLATAKAHRDELAALLATRSGSDGCDRSDDSNCRGRESVKNRNGNSQNHRSDDAIAPARGRAIADSMREGAARTEAPARSPSPTASPAGPEPPPGPPLIEGSPHDVPEAEAHFAHLSPSAYAAFTASPSGLVAARQRQPDGSWSRPLAVRPARFDTPPHASLPVCTGWCTGCGAPSTWRADPPQAPNPTVLRWRCIRCGGRVACDLAAPKDDPGERREANGD